MGRLETHLVFVVSTIRHVCLDLTSMHWMVTAKMRLEQLGCGIPRCVGRDQGGTQH